ncbi:MAG: lysoplasmalogenase [Deltaproteobacteria bacterium]|jgi:uncharacterized membrane protein YhhN|nr:lysoplasmalogenase [Deltaproteobacteria bacterium]
MLHETVNLSLSLLVFASGIACIRADMAGRRIGVYVFKPLTMLFVLSLALQSSASTSSLYAWLIVAGLLFSLAGDILLMLPSDRFAAGLASFLVAHLFYITAFAADAGFGSAPLALLPFVLGSAALYPLLRPNLGRLEIPVLLYMLVIAVMAWQAVARWLAVGQLGALLACIGAVLFVVSDALLALDRFHRRLPAAPALKLGTYFSGQWLIALSIGVGESVVDWIIR